jgi:hypothetical protein
MNQNIPQFVKNEHNELFQKCRRILVEQGGLKFYQENGLLSAEESAKIAKVLNTPETWINSTKAKKVETLCQMHNVTEEGLALMLMEQQQYANSSWGWSVGPTASAIWLSLEILRGTDWVTRLFNVLLVAPAFVGPVLNLLGWATGVPGLGAGMQMAGLAASAPAKFIVDMLWVIKPDRVVRLVEERLVRSKRMYGFIGSFLAMSAPIILLAGRSQYLYLTETLAGAASTLVNSYVAPVAGAIIKASPLSVQDGGVLAGKAAIGAARFMWTIVTNMFNLSTSYLGGESLAGQQLATIGLTLAGGAAGYYFLRAMYNGMSTHSILAGVLPSPEAAATIAKITVGLVSIGATAYFAPGFMLNYFVLLPLTSYVTTIVSQIAFVGVHYMRTGLTNYLLRRVAQIKSPTRRATLALWVSYFGQVLDGLIFIAVVAATYKLRNATIGSIYKAALEYMPGTAQKMIPAVLDDFMKKAPSLAGPSLWQKAKNLFPNPGTYTM